MARRSRYRTTRRPGGYLSIGRASPGAPAVYPRQIRAVAAVAGRQPWVRVRVCVYARYWYAPEIGADYPNFGDPEEEPEQGWHPGRFYWGFRCRYFLGRDLVRRPEDVVATVLDHFAGRRPIRMITIAEDPDR